MHNALCLSLLRWFTRMEIRGRPFERSKIHPGWSDISFITSPYTLVQLLRRHLGTDNGIPKYAASRPGYGASMFSRTLPRQAPLKQHFQPPEKNKTSCTLERNRFAKLDCRHLHDNLPNAFGIVIHQVLKCGDWLPKRKDSFARCLRQFTKRQLTALRRKSFV
jgi:hypothetical protein